MSRAKRFRRIAITLPEEDLAAADRLAATHDRSRSWILADALRRYVASLEVPGARVVSEMPRATLSTPPSEAGLGPSRTAQLQSDLSLTPEARVREAELTLQVTEPREQSRTNQLLVFDRYEDFLNWKRTRDLRR
jgi:hypothetical protein